MTTVGLEVGGTRVRFRVRGDADGEVAHAADQPYQVDRVVELTGRQLLACRRVAAEGEDVVDTAVPIARHDVGELGARVPDTREVCHGAERVPLVDPDHEVVSP